MSDYIKFDRPALIVLLAILIVLIVASVKVLCMSNHPVVIEQKCCPTTIEKCPCNSDCPCKKGGNCDCYGHCDCKECPTFKGGKK